MRTTKTNSTFRLAKATKRMLALGRFTSEEQRHNFRLMMIDAQVAASIPVKSSKERNTTKGE